VDIVERVFGLNRKPKKINVRTIARIIYGIKNRKDQFEGTTEHEST
jgi:hypothetical protein